MGKNGAASQVAGRGIRGRTLAAVLLMAAVLVGATGCEPLGGDGDGRGEVVRVIDGDTLVALIDGEETTIRLLNVDTPETKDPDEPVQCLGPEATEFLTERLPAGTVIELEYDEERLDRYDRTLAGVYESESLVNAEIAEAGLGVPVYFAPNDRFLREVEEASQRAHETAAGLFSDGIGCTLPAQLQAQSAAVGEVPATVEGDPADALVGAASVLEGVDVFRAALDSDGLPGLGNTVMARPLVASYLEDLREEADEVREDAQGAHTTLDELKAAYDEEQERLEQERLEEERLEEERLEEERLEQERLEKEEQERQEREERERQEQQQREERERQEQQEQREREQREPQQQPAPSAPSSSSGGSSDGSTGGESSGGDPSEGPGPSGCHPYGPEISYSDDGGYTGLRYGMPGGKTFRKCS